MNEFGQEGDLCLEKSYWQKFAGQENMEVGEGVERVSLVWALGLK